MRLSIILLLFLFINLPVHAQKKNKRSDKGGDSSGLLLSQMGKNLYDYEVAATTQDSLGNYQWRFLLAESGLRSKVNKEIAENLTAFLFTCNPNTGRYNGEVLRTKQGVDQQLVLAMIFQQLRQNLRQYGSNIDFVKIEGKYYYVLYFPYEKEQ